MAAWIWGQLVSQLAWTLALAAAPFLALGLGRPADVGVGVVLAQILRLAPLLAGRLAGRPGLALAGANLAAAALLPAAVFGGWPVLVYGAAGLVGVLEGWLGPVALREGLKGPALGRANGVLVALQVAVPALAWPLGGLAVGRLGPGPVLLLAAGLFGLRALTLRPWWGLASRREGIGKRALGLAFGLPFFFLLVPVGALAARLPAMLGPTGYGFFNQAFALGAAAGALLAGRRRLGLVGGGLGLAAGALAFWAGAYIAGGVLYGLGLGAVQVAGLGFLAGRAGAGELAGVLAQVAAAAALGGAAGALLAAWPPVLLLPLVGLLLAPLTLRLGRRP